MADHQTETDQSPKSPERPADQSGEQALGFISAIEQQLTDLRRVASEAQRRDAEHALRQAELRKQRIEIESRAAEIDALRADLDEKLASLAAERQRAHEEAAEKEQAAKDKENALQLQESSLAERAARLEEAERRTREREVEVESGLAECRRQQQALASEQAEVKAQTEQCVARLKDLETQLEDARTQAELVRREAATHAETLGILTAERDRTIADLHAINQAAATRHATDIEALAAARAEELAASDARIAELSGKVVEASQKLDAMTVLRDEAIQELQRAPQNDANPATIEALTRQLNESLSAASQTQRALAQREETLRVLAERLLNTEERLVAKDAELSEVHAKVSALSTLGPRDPDWVTLRRQRLARYREMLASQSRKIIAAKGALQRKQEQCEEILAQRARLSEQASLVEAQSRLVAARAARTGAAALVFYVAASLAVVSGLAWAVGGHLAPAYFAAKATLKAEVQGHEATIDELNTWTSTHERLATDPEFYQLVAARFNQRGMAALGTPAAVKQRFDQDLSLQTDATGKLTLELRGQGRERTERELETAVLSLMHLANAFRDQRGDGAATSLAEQPKAGNEPFKDERLAYVAGVGGAGLLACAVLGFGGYKLMARGKQNFELQMAAAQEG